MAKQLILRLGSARLGSARLGPARLEGEGEAGDITMSRDFVEDLAVAEILRSYDQREREARFKGKGSGLTSLHYFNNLQHIRDG